MPAAPNRPHRKSFASAPLLAVTALVLLVHALLLGGMPSAFGLLTQSGAANDLAPSNDVHSFVTRTLTAEPVPAPAATRPARPAPAKPARAVPPPQQAPSTEGLAAPAPEAAPDANAQPDAGGETTLAVAGTVVSDVANNAASGPQAGASAAVSPLPALPEGAQTPPSPAVADTALQAVSRVLLPPPVRLLYDGRGEERGFIKYSGSGEITWEPDGLQYKARLEISTWGVRVRTWTSKGTLGTAGLEPLRFGDKPRGAELATHFQRDKNIISFSANNPDVPLQMGAQDKLSALLQLSAVVAGAPEQFADGSSIRFQAADAHRAEPWHFKVGALEALDLPGGPLQGLKLSKAPTVEFDQAIEVWLAPALHYLPVRLRITEANGDFVDLLWKKTQKPEGS